MAYNYLGLTNDVALRLNETQLTSSNFATSTGFYASIKEAVNSSIRHVNQAHFFWPYNHADQTDTLTGGVSRYALPKSKYEPQYRGRTSLKPTNLFRVPQYVCRSGV